MRATMTGAITAATLLLSGLARAGDTEAADAAFRRGIALMESGELREACAAFEESERLESKAGTLLNLAGCYERAARWDEAYRTFEKARDSAHARQRSDWEAIASEHMASIRPKIALVTIDAEGVTSLPGARVTVDGRAVSDDERRRGIALARGEHVIRAEATGYRASAQTITTPPDARVKILPLEREAAAVAAPMAGREPERTPVRKTVGLAFGATGVAALAFGAVSGIVASGALSDAKGACSSYPDNCTSQAAEPNDRATTWSTISTVGLISGVAFLAVGVVLHVWPSSHAAAAKATPGVPSKKATTLLSRGGGVGLTF